MIEGRVVDATSRAPLESFELEIRMSDPRTGRLGRPFATRRFEDTDGVFRLDDLHVGTYTLHARAPGHARAATEPITLEPGRVVPELLLALDPGGSVAGRIVGARTGQPIARVTVQALILVEGRGWLVRGEPVSTDADGRFRLEHLEQGTHCLLVQDAEHVTERTEPFEIHPGQGPLVLPETRLVPGATLGGSLSDVHGLPATGLTVTLRPAVAEERRRVQGISHGSGYRFRQLAPGAYLLSVVRRARNDPLGSRTEQLLSLEVWIEEGVDQPLDLHLER